MLTFKTLGFLTIAGDTKVRFLPSPWPADQIPKPTSSLLSIAQQNELIAGAGPEGIVIGSTSAVRNAFTQDGPAENHFKPFAPQLTIQTPRISQLAFSSDESTLTLCADDGGGLAVYDVQKLKQGTTQPAFQLGTNSIGVRALMPNPDKENGHIMALVLTDGKLMLANLREKNFSNGANGPVLREGVSCLSWSSKGKQLVAGQGDGTAVQMAPDGAIKAVIPRPPQLQGDQHISGITWLDNDTFFIIYTPTNFEMDHAPDSTFIIVTRQKGTSNFTFQKMQEPLAGFGMNRSPPHHFLSRLRNFPPDLTDVLFLASTASADLGLVASSKAPLSSEAKAAQAVGAYVPIMLANDTRRAQLPVSEDLGDTSPIGLALDLTSRDPVKQPIPGEDIELSPTPLPAVVVLNHEGILSIWWFVYSDSIRKGTIATSLLAAPDSGNQNVVQSAFGASTSSQPAFGTRSAFGAPASAQPAFGAPSTTSQSPWGKPAGPAFESSTFGTSTTSAGPSSSAFGSSSMIGNRQSAWGSNITPGAAQTGGAQFGQPSVVSAQGGAFGNTGMPGKTASPWSTGGTQQPQQPGASPFGAFSGASQASPFASFGKPAESQNQQQQSVFGNNAASSPFGSFGQGSSKPAWGAAETSGAPGLSMEPSTGSTMTIGSNLSSFGAPSTIKSPWATPALSNNTSDGVRSINTISPEAEMAEDTPTESDFKPPAAPSEGRQDAQTSAFGSFKFASTFKGDGTAKDDLPKPSESSLFGSSFTDALKDTDSGGPSKAESSTQGAASSPATQDLPEATKNEPTIVTESAPLPPSPGSSTVKRVPEPKAESTTLPPMPEEKSDEQEQAPADNASFVTRGRSSSPKGSSETVPESAPLPLDFAPKPTWQFGDTTPKAKKAPSPTTNEPSLPEDSPLPPADDTPVTNTRSRATVQPPLYFPQPTDAKESPKSPSPVRNQQRTPGQRSLSSPSPTRGQRIVSTTPTAPAPMRPPTQTAPRTSPAPRRLAPVQETTLEKENEIEDLTDEADDRIREELDQPIEASKVLEPFLAHQDYIGSVSGQGVPAQIEKVYRDINSMIDTLGLNARSLAAFVKGQHEMFRDGGRDRNDLETPDGWSLVEIEDLGLIQKGLVNRLDADAPQTVTHKIAEVQHMHRELVKLRSRNLETQKLVQSYRTPQRGDESNSMRDRQLSSEQSAVLNDLRNDFAQFQELLAQAEDVTSMLRAKLSSAQAQQNGRSEGIPTVEAVMNTIAKMTRMVEQKSGDLDVLEAQMRRARFRPKSIAGPLDEALERLTITNGDETDRDISTPMSKSRHGTFELQYSPDETENGSAMRSSLRSSVRGERKGRPSQRSKAPPEQVAAVVARRKRGRMMLNILKEGLAGHSS